MSQHPNLGNQGGYNWQGHAHTVPQSHRSQRRTLPQTPNVPSTLSAKSDQPQFNAIDPRHGIKYVKIKGVDSIFSDNSKI